MADWIQVSAGWSSTSFGAGPRLMRNCDAASYFLNSIGGDAPWRGRATWSEVHINLYHDPGRSEREIHRVPSTKAKPMFIVRDDWERGDYLDAVRGPWLLAGEVLLLLASLSQGRRIALPSIERPPDDERGDPRESSMATSPDVTAPAVTGMDADAFWGIVDGLRLDVDGRSELMAEGLPARLEGVDEEGLRSFHARFAEATGRLATWQHLAAAEMISGFVSDDVFTDWRSWVVTLGRDAYERVAENPDNLADVEDLAVGFEEGGEMFAAAVTQAVFDRLGYVDELPVAEPLEPPTPEMRDPAAIRRMLPRLSARIPDDGLGQGPRQYTESD